MCGGGGVTLLLTSDLLYRSLLLLLLERPVVITKCLYLNASDLGSAVLAASGLDGDGLEASRALLGGGGSRGSRGSRRRGAGVGNEGDEHEKEPGDKEEVDNGLKEVTYTRDDQRQTTKREQTASESAYRG